MRFLVLDLGFLGSNFSLCFLVSGEMFSSSSSNFRGLFYGERSNQGGGGRADLACDLTAERMKFVLQKMDILN